MADDVKSPWHGSTFRTSLECAVLVTALVTYLVFDARWGPSGAQPRLALAGTAASFHSVAVAGSTGLTHALRFDLGFAALFGIAGWRIVVLARDSGCVPRYRFGALQRDRTGRLPTWIAVAPIAAAALDLVENILCLSAGTTTSIAGVITVIAWWKIVAYAVAIPLLLALAYDVVVPHAAISLSRRVLSFPDHLPTTGSHKQYEGTAGTNARPASGGTAICVSGGGIRAAAVAHGALRRFDQPQGSSPSLFRDARWLASVSGGGYTAAGWAISRFPWPTPIDPPSTATTDGLFTAGGPYAQSVRTHRQYLYNGFLGLTGGLAQVLMRTVLSLGALGAIAALLGFGGGELTRSWAVCRAGTSYRGIAGCDVWQVRTAAPGLIVAGLGVLSLPVAAALHDEQSRQRATRFASAAAAAGALLLVALVGLPAAVVWLHAHPSLAIDSNQPVATSAPLLSTGGLLVALLGVLRTQATSVLKRHYARLGGVLLALLLAVVVIEVAIIRSSPQPGSNLVRFWSHDFLDLDWLPFAALVWLATVAWIPAHRFTLNGLYRKRVAGTFALRKSGADIVPVDYSDEPLIAEYPHDQTPELVTYFTQHSRRRQPGGVRASGVAASRAGVTSYRWPTSPDPGSFAPWGVYPTGSWWAGFPRGWIVSRAMAISGAAFGSAMGRSSLGTTNALLAALNLRTGIWVPNPQRLDYWPTDGQGPRSPRVGFGYFLKEVFGLYSPERDPFIFVSDGGHLENLGLVAILPRKPERIFVVDASGDKPGTFSTLREAIDLAKTQLDVTVELPWERLRAADGASYPTDCAIAGTVRYWDGTQAEIFYGRYQLCMQCPAELLSFASTDKAFPYYGLVHQSLSAEQFDHLVALGDHVADRLIAMSLTAPNEGQVR